MRTIAASTADRFLALLKPIERDLETYCRRLMWEPQEAPDAIQNAVLRAFALNRKHARIARFEFQLDPEELAKLPLDGDPDQSPNDPCFTGTLNEALDPALAAGLKTLTETERAALLLRAIGGLRYREIGETLSIPLGSVMGNLSRARQKMRILLARSARRANALKENSI